MDWSRRKVRVRGSLLPWRSWCLIVTVWVAASMLAAMLLALSRRY